MQKTSIDHAWWFTLDGKADEEPAQAVDLPHDWSIAQPRQPDAPSGFSGGYFPMGRGRYMKTLDVPEEWRWKKVLIEFEGVYMNAEVRLNEHFITRHPYGYTSFIVDLTPYLHYGAKNELQVSVDNASQLNSRWYSGSGIYRPAWLIVAEKVHIGHWGTCVTTPQVSAETAAVSVKTKVENETDAACEVTLRSRVMAPDGTTAGVAESSAGVCADGSYEFSQEIAVSMPKVWSPESPSLYRLESELWMNGALVDTAETWFGIRTLRYNAVEGFVLNGTSLKMKGGCVHHDNGILGAASYARAEERKVELHKANGYNAIRCAHNPPAPAFLDACDRLGMLVIDEAFDCWHDGKNPYDYHTVFEDWWQRDLESMLYRDRNHASIVVWSIGNEVLERDGRSDGMQIARKLAETVRAVDSTRPITAAICGTWDNLSTWESMDAVFATLDIGGYNYQFKNYCPDHERNAQRVMFGTESAPKEAYENWTSVQELSYVIGDFVWTSLDYLGESGIGRVHFGGEKEFSLGAYPWHQANCGDLDLCGFKRPQSYYRDILWERGDPLYIAVHTPVPEGKTPVITYWGWPDVAANWTWPGHEGETLTVDVYSAYAAVELFLNGKSLGMKMVERCIASFDVSYEAGELKAVGIVEGAARGQCTVRTVGAPVRIHLSPDRSVIRRGGEDLCYVTVEIVDALGAVHPNADRPVYFTVQGNGVIAAVGSANPVSTESYRGNVRSTFHGRALVVVKSGIQAGEIWLRAQADGLDGAEVAISAE